MRAIARARERERERERRKNREEEGQGRIGRALVYVLRVELVEHHSSSSGVLANNRIAVLIEGREQVMVVGTIEVRRFVQQLEPP